MENYNIVFLYILNIANTYVVKVNKTIKSIKAMSSGSVSSMSGSKANNSAALPLATRTNGAYATGGAIGQAS